MHQIRGKEEQADGRSRAGKKNNRKRGSGPVGPLMYGGSFSTSLGMLALNIPVAILSLYLVL